ncbi:MAG: glycosyltransferase family 9 protein [Calditrichaeota bacterium]|nr:glycosyltransferase family 9 protein [Calditrichota bacterium]
MGTINADGKRIAALLFRRIGDSLLAIPALRAIKLKYPNSHICVLSESHVKRVFEGLEFVDQVVDVERSPSAIALGTAIRNQKADIALDFLSDPRTAIACALSRAHTRIGFSKSVRQFLYTHRIAIQNPRTPVYSAVHKLEFAKALNAANGDCLPAIALSEENEKHAKEKMGVEAAKTIAMYVTSRRDYKRWPLDRYSDISRKLRSEGFRIAVIAGPGEAAIASEFCAKANLADESIASFQDIGDMAAFLKLCNCFVGNDGGPKHLAVAVGTRTITVFQNDPWEYWTPPNSPQHIAVGGPNVSPDIAEVWQAIKRLLIDSNV